MRNTLAWILLYIRIAFIFQVIGLICLGLLRHYGLDFGASGWADSDSFRDRYLVGVITLGASILIAIPLVVGYVFFESGSNLLVCIKNAFLWPKWVLFNELART